MEKFTRCIGIGSIVLGSLLVAADLILRTMGILPSFNLGDPSKFEFYLVSLWHIGVGVLAVGAGNLAMSGRAR